MVEKNLSSAFPHKSPEQLTKIKYRFYHNLAEVIVETLKARTLSKKAFAERVKVLNPEVFERYFDQGKSIIAMASHQCNWEWVLLGCRAHFDQPMFPVYQPITNAYFENLMRKIRSRFGGQPIPMQQTLREILNNRDTPAAYGLVADQVPMHHSEKHWTQFLQQETAFYNGPAKIAQKMGYPAVYIKMNRTKRGYYQVELIDLGMPSNTNPPSETTEAYARALEHFLQANPADWLWSHNRWKHKREG